MKFEIKQQNPHFTGNFEPFSQKNWMNKSFHENPALPAIILTTT